MKHPDILIIGGGISGLLSAITLADAGLTVEVLERGERALESSWAGAGILSALPPWGYSPAVTDLIETSQALWPDWIARLRSEAQTDPEYQVSGMLILGCENSTTMTNSGEHQNPTAPIPTQLATLAARYQQTHWLPQVAQVRNPRLLAALRECALKSGVCLLPYTEVTRLIHNKTHIVGIETSAGIRSAERFVITAGAWSQTLLGELGHALKITPVRGQIVQLKSQPDTVPAIILIEKHYLVPRQDGLVLVGSTLENVGFDKAITFEAQKELLSVAYNLFPALRKAPVVQQWAGLRPGSPNNIPRIGRHPDIDNLFINSGHFRYGVTMGPSSARVLTDQMLGRPLQIDARPYQWQST